MQSPGLLLVAAALQVGFGSNPSTFDRLSAHLTVLGVVVGRDTLATAQKRLGRAQMRHNGLDAAASADAACYVGPDGTALAFISIREAGDGRQLLTDIHLAVSEPQLLFSPGFPESAHEANRPKCARLSKLSRGTATKGGLRLGMSVKEVRTLLGIPSEESADVLTYNSYKKEPYGHLSVRIQVARGIVTGVLSELDPLG